MAGPEVAMAMPSLRTLASAALDVSLPPIRGRPIIPPPRDALTVPIQQTTFRILAARASLYPSELACLRDMVKDRDWRMGEAESFAWGERVDKARRFAADYLEEGAAAGLKGMRIRPGDFGTCAFFQLKGAV